MARPRVGARRSDCWWCLSQFWRFWKRFKKELVPTSLPIRSDFRIRFVEGFLDSWSIAKMNTHISIVIWGNEVMVLKWTKEIITRSKEPISFLWRRIGQDSVSRRRVPNPQSSDWCQRLDAWHLAMEWNPDGKAWLSSLLLLVVRCNCGLKGGPNYLQSIEFRVFKTRWLGAVKRR